MSETKSRFVVSADWLQSELGKADLRVLDASFYLPAQKRDADAEYAAGHIPGAIRFDQDKIADHSTSLPHTIPSPDYFAAEVGRLGISENDRIVVYDGIGKTTFPASLDCLRPLGYFVSFGSASGQIEAFNINILQTKGSLFATRPTLNNYVAKRDDLVATAADLFKVVGSGAVKIPINQKYPLKDAAKAHKEMEGRDTTGSTILMP